MVEDVSEANHDGVLVFFEVVEKMDQFVGLGFGYTRPCSTGTWPYIHSICSVFTVRSWFRAGSGLYRGFFYSVLVCVFDGDDTETEW